MSACWWLGTLMPAMRAMGIPRKLEIIPVCSRPYQPWRCLWRGSEQITRTTPLRRTILHLRQIFFTDAITFMSCSCRRLLRAEGDAPLGQVVGRELHRHLVAGPDADVVHAHLSRNETMNHVAVFQLHLEGRIGQVLHHLALHLDEVFLGHERNVSAPAT